MGFIGVSGGIPRKPTCVMSAVGTRDSSSSCHSYVCATREGDVPYPCAAAASVEIYYIVPRRSQVDGLIVDNNVPDNRRSGSYYCRHLDYRFVVCLHRCSL